MYNATYKGIANDEYGLYETLDNGRTWVLKGSAPPTSCAKSEVHQRIIYGSEENQGLRYSDDGGVTLIASDHPTGNWDGITYKNDKVYAHSMDGLGIFTSEETESNGIGEIWTKVCDAGETLNETYTLKDGSVGFSANGILTVVNANNEVENFPNSKIESGEVVLNDIEDDIRFGGGLLFVLNKIMLPKLVFDLTGTENQEILNSFSDGLTMGAVSYNKYFTDNQLFFGRASEGKDFTNADFQNIVGMMPLVIKNEDFADEIDTTTIPISESANLPEETHETLADTLSILDDILEIKKEYAVEKMTEKILSVEVDCSNLIDETLTQEEQENALYMQKLFLDVQKGSTISIVGTMLSSIYSFDTARKIALLKAAIHETIIKEASSIQYQLKQIERKLNTPDYTITKEDLTINYDFATGLETAIKNYLDTVFRNIRMKLENPKDLKSIAAAWYKDYYRDEVLQGISNALESRIITVSDPDVTTVEGVKDYLDSIYNELENQINNYLETVKYDDYYSDDDELGAVEGVDIEELQGYERAICGKFKERCIELLSLIYDSFIANMSSEEQDVYEFYKAYLVENSVEKTTKQIANQLKKSWISMKEMI